MALVHGGQLQQVAKQYNIPVQEWIDLSTGIAPISYPIPDIPASAWQHLPQYNAELVNAAKQYYQSKQLVVTNGSQAIIKALPALYQQQNPNSKHVYLPERGYKEHGQAWKVAGYQLHFYQDTLPEFDQLQRNCVVVIINPNNPTGHHFEHKTIGQYHDAVKQVGGLLVIDEAFIDVMPTEQSYCQKVNSGHCLVLRSFGKFFGLAGIRIGFLIANRHWCETFEELLGPWQVNNPAQIIAQQALVDTSWQEVQKTRLHELRTAQEDMLKQVLSNKIMLDIKGCDLFLTVRFHNQVTAKKLYHLLCQQAVYCRLADEQDTLRFGIVITNSIKRLEKALQLACTQLT